MTGPPAPIPVESRGAWIGAAWATALTVSGMLIELVIVRDVPGAPWVPVVVSAVVGAVLFALLMVRRRNATIRFCSIVFMINTISVAIVLWITNDHFARVLTNWFPFQPNKLCVCVVALLAPALWVGIASMVAHAGGALVQYMLFPPEIRASLDAEPWATIAFGGFATALLFYNMRRLELERRVVASTTKATTAEHFARLLLAIRDAANTPLQTIELNVSLLEIPAEREAARIRIERSLARLRDLSLVLTSRSPQATWQPDAERFDAWLELTARSRRTSH